MAKFFNRIKAKNQSLIRMGGKEVSWMRERGDVNEQKLIEEAQNATFILGRGATCTI